MTEPERDTDGLQSDKVYGLPKSRIRLQGRTLSIYAGDSVIADYPLSNIYEFILKFGRSSQDRGCLIILVILFGGSVAGFLLWAYPAGSEFGCVALGVLAFFWLTGIISLYPSKSAWFVLVTRDGKIEYKLEEERHVLEAFFSQIRKHALEVGLRIEFRVQEGSRTFR